ncbi:MAG: hypothetical protein PVH61_40820 [Candidatus Aminicenantes bacterium]|jgi:hypothetical protein
MKRLIFLVIVVLVIGGGCDSFKKWEPFESDDGWFRAEFPGRPKVRKMPMSAGTKTLYIHMFMVDRSNGGYAVGYMDLPEIKTDVNPESQEFIESMARGSFNQIGTGNFTKKVIDFEGYPGLEAEGKFKKGSTRGLARIRYYVVQKRIYILEVIGKNSFVNSGDTERFFNSFQLIYEDE